MFIFEKNPKNLQKPVEYTRFDGMYLMSLQMLFCTYVPDVPADVDLYVPDITADVDPYVPDVPAEVYMYSYAPDVPEDVDLIVPT